MISFLNIEVSNNPYNCCIELHFTTTLQYISGFNKIDILRKEGDSISWRKVYSRNVSEASDLDFTVLDLLTLPGKIYTYSVDIRNDTEIPTLSQTLDPVECWYEGMFIGNANYQFVAGTNFQVSPKLNTVVEYVNTLGSRTPYRVSNAETCYYTGDASGLFLRLTPDKKRFVPDYDHTYSISVADFLSYGEDFILKTPEGQIWLVAADKVIDLKNNERFLGMNEVEFSWTETGDLPLAWVVDV